MSLDATKAIALLHNKKFAVSLTTVTADGLPRIRELDIWRDGCGYMFHLHETNSNITFQTYPHKEGHRFFKLTPQFVEDCITIQMVQRECWNVE